jgi:hypothetical protein
MPPGFRPALAPIAASHSPPPAATPSPAVHAAAWPGHRKPEIDRITMAAASALLDGAHYLGALEFSPRYCLAAPQRDALAVFATPTASAFERALPGCLELTRLWQAQSRRDSTGAMNRLIAEKSNPQTVAAPAAAKAPVADPAREPCGLHFLPEGNGQNGI